MNSNLPKTTSKARMAGLPQGQWGLRSVGR